MTPHYVLIELERVLRAGWLSAKEGRRVHIVLEDGTSVLEPMAHVLYEWEGEPVPPEESGAALAQLRREAAREIGTCGAFDAPALYARVGPGGRWTFERIAAELLGEHAPGWDRARLFRWLRGQDAHFRPTRGAFIARSETEMRQRAAREAAQRAHLRRLEQVAGWRDELERGAFRAADPEQREFLAQLQSLLIQETRSPQWKALGSALDLPAHDWPGNRARLKRWLEAAGTWRGWAPIWLAAAEVPEQFPPEVAEAADALAASPLDSGGRRDYRGLDTITLDSPGTLDFDDGLSILGSLGEGLEIACHVADPSHALSPGDRLFEEAALRASSVYTQQAIFPMLPEPVSNRRYSLVSGQDREAVTFRLRIEPGKAELLAIEPSLVRVTENLDYARGEARLAEGSWTRLVALCDSLAKARVRAGATLMIRPEVVIDVSDPEHLRLVLVDRHDPPHRLVEELAILVNREAGRFCQLHRLPAFYRVQPREIAARRRAKDQSLLPAAYFSLEGGEHAGLACDRYVQVTSPLRRFADLVMQRQIASQAVAGRPAFTDAAQLEAWMKHIELRATAYQQLERRLDDYWKRRYLSQNLGLELSGVVRHNGGAGHGRAYLDDIQLEVQAHLAPSVNAGQKARFRVIASDPDREVAEVVIVEKPA